MNSKPAERWAVAKPYPRRCVECGTLAVEQAVIPYDARMKHDGKLHQFHIPQLPVDRCSECGEVFFTNATTESKSHALRQQLGLLQPDEIRAFLNQHGLTQRKFAEHLRVAEESVSRWLNGLSIQSRSLDAFMRVYFSIPQVREMLSQEGGSDCPEGGPKNSNAAPTPANLPNVADSPPVHPIFRRRFTYSQLMRCQRFQLTPSLN